MNISKIYLGVTGYLYYYSFVYKNIEIRFIFKNLDFKKVAVIKNGLCIKII